MLPISMFVKRITCTWSCRVWILLTFFVWNNNYVYSSPYCSNNATLSDIKIPSCLSCQQCGLQRGRDVKPCFCDKHCLVYNDCCRDFNNNCPQEAEMGRKLVQGLRKDLNNFHCTDTGMEGLIEQGQKYLLVTTCNKSKTACVRRPDSIYDFLPVTDPSTGLHYVNFKCAVCNEVSSVIPWNMTVDCVQKVRPDRITYNLTDLGIPEPGRSVTGCVNRLRIEPSDEVPAHTCQINAVSTCSPDCNNTELVQRCEEGGKQYLFSWISSYKNPYCVLCNGGIPTGMECSPFGFGGVGIFSFYSLPILFDFSMSDGFRVGGSSVKKTKCSEGQFPEIHICETEPNRETRKRLPDANHKNCSFINNCSDGQLVGQLSEWTELLTEILNLNVSISIDVKMPAMLVKVAGKTDQSNTERMVIYQAVIDVLFRTIYEEFENGKLDVFIFIQNLTMKETQSCAVRKTYTNRTINTDTELSFEHLIYNGSSYLCIAQRPNRAERLVLTSGVSEAIGILTLSLQIISVISLIFRIIAHFLLPEFHNSAGRVQLSLVIAILTSLVTFVVAPLVRQRHVTCYVVAVTLHWTLLASFTWMSVVAFDIWWMVLQSTRLRAMGTKNKTFLYFSIVGWGLPTLLTSVSLLVDKVGSDPKFRAAYGSRDQVGTCWISNKYALLTQFIAPVGFSMALNVIFFVMTLRLLSRAKSNKVPGTSSARSHAFLYFKIFILIGSTWILGIVAELVNHDVMFYLFTLLNASQGFFIAMATFASKRTRAALQKKIHHLRHPKMRSPSRSSITPLTARSSLS